MKTQRLAQGFVSADRGGRTPPRSASDCIGRVGALAAALGVGAVMFAVPWTAAADTDSGSSTSSSSSSSTGSSSSDGSSSTGSSPSSGTASDSDSSDDTDSGASSDSGDSSDSGNSGAADSSDTDTDSDAEEADDLLSEVEDLESDADDSSNNGAVGTDYGDDEAIDPVTDDGDEIDEVDPVTDDENDRDSSDSTVESTKPASEATAPARTVELDAGPVDEAAAEFEPAAEVSERSAASVPVSLTPVTTAATTTTATVTAADSEPPARALQSQPGTFIEVATSLLSAVLAPFMAPGNGPAQPAASPGMWGVLSFVRREIEDTFANFSISVGGHTLVQNGTAVATSQGFGSLAIAHGENATASASGWFNVAVVRGDDSTATSDGDFTRVRVRGDDNTAQATGSLSYLRVQGHTNDATSTGAGNRVEVVGNDNDATATAAGGARAEAAVYGNDNTAEATGGKAVIVGDDSVAVADGIRNLARVWGDSSTARAEGENNTAFVWGDNSSSTAGPGVYNNAISLGDNLIADTGAGNGNTVFGQSVNPDNQAPVAGTPEPFTVDPTTGVVTGTAVFTDPDGDTLTYHIAEGPNDAELVLTTATGEFTFTPHTRPPFGDPDGTAMFTIEASDGQATATTVITVPVAAQPDPGNQAPVAGTPSTPTVNTDTGEVTGTLGFSDPDGDMLTYTLDNGPDNGEVTLNTDGTYSYTPATRPPFGDPDTSTAFTVTAADPDGLTATTTITVPVAAQPDPGNTAPVANSDAYSLDEGDTLVIVGPGVLDNDADADGDPLTAVIGTGPANGTFMLNPDGSFSYTPDGGFTGTDTFTYTAFDGTTDSNVATVTLTVNAADAESPTLQGIAEIPGDPVRQPQVGPDGTVYQVVVFGLGTSDQHTSIYAVNPDATVDLDNPIVDMAAGGADSRLAFAPNRFAFQTTFDYVNQTGNVVVIDLENPGMYSIVQIGSARLFDSDLAVGPDGSAYLLADNSTQPTTLTVIDPENPDDVTTLELPDVDPAGPLVFSRLDGTPYVVNETVSPEERVQLFAIDITSPDDPLTLVAEGEGQLANDGVVAGPGGAVYLTTRSTDFDTGESTTHVVMLDPDNAGAPVQFDLAGIADDGVVIGPDGTVFQAMFSFTVENGDITTLMSTTHVAIIDPANADSPAVFDTAGAPLDVAQVGPGDTLYMLTGVTDYSTTPSSSTYHLAILDPQAPGGFTRVDLDSEPAGMVVGPDGTAFIALPDETVVDGETVSITNLTIVDPDNLASPTVIEGIVGDLLSVVVNADGVAFLTAETLEDTGFVSHVTVIDPGNTDNPILATYDVDGPAASQEGATIGPDGTAYLATLGGGVGEDITNVAVIGVGPAAQMM